MAVDERTWSQFFDSSMDAAVAANFCWFYRLPSIVCLGLIFFAETVNGVVSADIRRSMYQSIAVSHGSVG